MLARQKELTGEVGKSSFAASLDEASTGMGCTPRSSCTDSAASEVLADERCRHCIDVLDVIERVEVIKIKGFPER